MKANKQKVVIFSGAGLSVESGIPPFRGHNGLWNNIDINKIATKDAMKHNLSQCLKFYNERRKAIEIIEPSIAHTYLKKLEEKYHVSIITTNIDNLHEKSGFNNVIHLHGNITQTRSIKSLNRIYDWKEDLTKESKDLFGYQLRPNIVLFDEKLNKDLIIKSRRLIEECDILIVIGTSLVVQPACNLINFAQNRKININIESSNNVLFTEEYLEGANIGVQKVVDKLLLNN